jgi:hypothetical protein
MCSYLVVIAVKEGEEGGLSSCCAFNASESNIISRSNQIPQVPKQFLLSAPGPQTYMNTFEKDLGDWSGISTCNHKVARLPTVVS